MKPTPVSSIRIYLLTWLGLAVAFGLRLYRLGQESLWYDELVSVDLAQSGVAQLLAQTARDIHPPGYYLLLALWDRLANPIMELGQSFEFLFGFPSVFFGVLVCALAYKTTRLFFSRRTATLALWLTALHPFQLVYAQEVRMYTLGALLCLLYFVLTVHLVDRAVSARPRRLHAASLAIVTAAGLYTFYYFGIFAATATLALALWGVVRWRTHGTPPFRAAILSWYASQFMALLLWTPWLPAFVRQALDPPVPPWRAAWTGLGDALEAWATLIQVYLGGHALELALHDFVPIQVLSVTLVVSGIVVVVAFYGYAKNYPESGRTKSHAAFVTLAGFALGPPLVLIGLSLWITPLFHARYLYVFHAPFLILLAAALAAWTRVRPLASSAAIVCCVAFFAWAAQFTWSSPLLRSDEHRQAVADIAAAWRPGDVILVNAGWAYRAFSVYWPTRATSSHTALPPPLTPRLRLGAHNPGTSPAQAGADSVPLYYSGSLDTEGNLGWSHPDADFYSVDGTTLQDDLARLSNRYTGLWHYRIYDTVSDPSGVVRAWLAANASPIYTSPIPGRDFLQVGYHRFESANQEHSTVSGATPGTVHFTNGLTVELAPHPRSIAAGQAHYVPLRLSTNRAMDANTLGASLRLLDGQSKTVLQEDETLPALIASSGVSHWLRLPIPISLAPGDYTLQLIIYARATLAPLNVESVKTPSADAAVGISTGNGTLGLGELVVELAKVRPLLPATRAQFDYLRLVQVDAPTQIELEQPVWPLRLVWLPQASPYRDTYDALIRLVAQEPDLQGTDPDALTWRRPLGPPHHPSGDWPTGYPVSQWEELTLPVPLPPGSYTLQIGLQRTADHAPIPPRRSPWGIVRDTLRGDARGAWVSLEVIKVGVGEVDEVATD